jgi:predicted Holliday junction resolvase-like endonuclease
MEFLVSWWLLFILFGSFFVTSLCFKLKSAVSELKSRLRSQSTRYGQITEQFLPLVEAYPWDSKQFRFLGSPIDGIQFEEDKIVLAEFKSSFSKMSVKQRKIKELVEQGKVEFELIRVG